MNPAVKFTEIAVAEVVTPVLPVTVLASADGLTVTTYAGVVSTHEPLVTTAL